MSESYDIMVDLGITIVFIDLRNFLTPPDITTELRLTTSTSVLLGHESMQFDICHLYIYNTHFTKQKD